MTEPRLSELAKDDLNEVWFSIALSSMDSADRTVEAILEVSRLHVRFPNMGLSRDDLRLGLRCFTVSSYVVYYQPVESTIEILRILHGARNVESIFADET
jgi:toxin ParE1/3/4